MDVKLIIFMVSLGRRGMGCGMIDNLLPNGKRKFHLGPEVDWKRGWMNTRGLNEVDYSSAYLMVIMSISGFLLKLATIPY